MKKLFIAGHRGMVGSALVREAGKRGGFELVTAGRDRVDLCDQSGTFAFLAEEKPDVVIIAAAKVGGIHANSTYPADFIYENLAIASNCVEGSRRAGVGRVLFLGSSCIYPKLAPQPMPEDCLLTSPLEVTNEAYAIAKIAGLKLCQHYRAQHGLMYHSAMPTNLYGPGDNYHPENSHVIPALLRRFHEAREAGAESVTIWGTGTSWQISLRNDHRHHRSGRRLSGDESAAEDHLAGKGLRGARHQAPQLAVQHRRVDHIYQDPHEPEPAVPLHYGDLTDSRT
jgi:GDP-L-fucose synthase